MKLQQSEGGGFQLCHALFAEFAGEGVVPGGHGREAQSAEEEGGMGRHDGMEEASRKSQTLHGHQQDCSHQATPIRVFHHVPRSPALYELVSLRQEKNRSHHILWMYNGTSDKGPSEKGTVSLQRTLFSALIHF